MPVLHVPQGGRTIRPHDLAGLAQAAERLIRLIESQKERTSLEPQDADAALGRAIEALFQVFGYELSYPREQLARELEKAHGLRIPYRHEESEGVSWRYPAPSAL